MPIIALDFSAGKILLGFSLAGFFTGVGAELSKHLIHEHVIKRLRRIRRNK